MQLLLLTDNKPVHINFLLDITIHIFIVSDQNSDGYIYKAYNTKPQNPKKLPNYHSYCYPMINFHIDINFDYQHMVKWHT